MKWLRTITCIGWALMFVYLASGPITLPVLIGMIACACYSLHLAFEAEKL